MLLTRTDRLLLDNVPQGREQFAHGPSHVVVPSGVGGAGSGGICVVSDWEPDFLKRQRDLLDFARRKGVIKGSHLAFFNFLVDAAGRSGCCHWGNAALAEKFGSCNVRTIQGWLAKLENRGLIVCRTLKFQREIPGCDGEVVQEKNGIRLIIIIDMWCEKYLPGTPMDRRPARERKRGGIGRGSSQVKKEMTKRSSGRDDHVTAQDVRADHGGDDQSAYRKDATLIGGCHNTGEKVSDRGFRDVLASWPPELQEDFEERASVFEFDGGLSREDAEARAFRLIGGAQPDLSPSRTP